MFQLKVKEIILKCFVQITNCVIQNNLLSAKSHQNISNMFMDYKIVYDSSNLHIRENLMCLFLLENLGNVSTTIFQMLVFLIQNANIFFIQNSPLQLQQFNTIFLLSKIMEQLQNVLILECLAKYKIINDKQKKC